MKARGFVAAVLLALLLSACSAKADTPSMYIQPAGLTEEEEAVAKLLGADMDQYLFDVVLDGTAKKVSTSVYKLADGEWAPVIGGGGMALGKDNTEGRMAFGFEDLWGDYREAVQFGKDFTAVTRHAPEEERERMGRGATCISSRREIVYEQEIPLVIQFYSSSGTVRSINLEEFFQPESLEGLGCEHIYALTVTFSQEPLS